MKKPTQKQIKEWTKDPISNFSLLIDGLLYFDMQGETENAWDIVNTIEDIAMPKEIELLLKDINDRDFKVEENILYNGLWYAIVNNSEACDRLVEEISKKSNFVDYINFLKPLNEGNEETGDLNIQKAIKAILQKSVFHSNKTETYKI